MRILFTDLFHIKNKILRELVNFLIASLLMGALILLVLLTDIPNPNLFLMTGLVIATALFGFIPGSTGVIALILYSMWFFSTGHNWVSYTDINLRKVIVAVICSILCYAFVGALNLFYERSTLKVIEENKDLVEHNKTLSTISSRDVLTGLKNRFSLKNDINGYIGEGIRVMILDVDEFKQINDTYGHTFGDSVLKQVAVATKEIFGDDSVYRFGGDEFIIVKKDISLAEFKELSENLSKSLKSVNVEGNVIDAHLSMGYTFGVPTCHEDIKNMIKFADELLYKAKRNGKNQIIGERYDLDI